MHIRRFVSFLLGGWLAGSFFMLFVATQNFRQVDRLLANPAANAKTMLDSLGPGGRQLLRYLVGEQNRFYFDSWETVQLVLGTAVFVLLLFFTSARRLWLILTLVLLILVAGMHWLLTPQISAFGRVLDFVSPADGETVRRRFWALHNIYSGAEVTKIALLLLLSVRFLFGRQTRRGDVVEDLDEVDHADHGRVNR
jgi:hypothetical protein